MVLQRWANGHCIVLFYFGYELHNSHIMCELCRYYRAMDVGLADFPVFF